MARTTSHSYVGRLAQYYSAGTGLYTGLVRAAVVDGRSGRLTHLVVQRPGREASSVKATCCGSRETVPVARVRGLVNRRRAWPHQIEPLSLSPEKRS